MKPIKTIQSLLLLAVLAAGAVSCQKEKLPTIGGDTAQGTPLTISITDGGYTASNAKSSSATRAAENGYVTEFTAGDKIGLYVVKPDGTYVHENVALTLTDNGSGTLAWTPPTGTTLYYEGAAAKYFAYYPYQSTLTGTLSHSATDAAGFFADVVLQWTPVADQSSYAKYTAQDLMTGSGTVSKQADAYTLALSMTHTMALVVIETPMTKYTLTDKSSSPLPDYYIPAPDTKFHGFTPYSPSLGTYRLLVKPAQSGATDLMGSYTAANGNTKEYAIVQNNIAAANYVHSKVDGGATTVITKTHTLQVGDFYLKDGSLLGKDATLSDAQKAVCIGVVFKAGRDGSGDWKDDCDYKQKDGVTPMATVHGYVLALYDANDGNTCQWSSYDTSVTHSDMNREKETGFYGYKNTNAIKAFAADNGKNLQTDFPATYYATADYETRENGKYAAPANSSGWFLPSAGQGKYWLNNRNMLLASVKEASGASGYSWKGWYWSSSEDIRNPARDAWVVGIGIGIGYVNYSYKSSGGNVRGVFAF